MTRGDAAKWRGVNEIARVAKRDQPFFFHGSVDKSVGKISHLWIADVDRLAIVGISFTKPTLLTIWGVNVMQSKCGQIRNVSVVGWRLPSASF